MYRDRLTENERIVLDDYREKLDAYFLQQKQATENPVVAAPAADPGVVAASTVGLNPPALEMAGHRDTAAAAEAAAGGIAPVPDSPTGSQAFRQAPNTGIETINGPTNTKEKARWMLHQARDQIRLGHLDTAEQMANEAVTLNVKWGYFDDSPVKVKETLAKARARTKGAEPNKAAGEAEYQPRDRRAAKAKLKEARAALAMNDTDKADAIARELKSWDLHYGFFDDNPHKLAASVAEARRRDAARSAELMVRSHVGNSAGTRGEPAVPVATDPRVAAPR
jgi:hypothetical protein